MSMYVVIFGFFVVAFLFMALALHFSRYRQRQGTCCTDVLHGLEEPDFEACYTCPNRDSEECMTDDLPNPNPQEKAFASVS